jgi:hypothetical protein
MGVAYFTNTTFIKANKKLLNFELQNKKSLEDSLVSGFKLRLLHSFHWDSIYCYPFFMIFGILIKLAGV